MMVENKKVEGSADATVLIGRWISTATEIRFIFHTIPYNYKPDRKYDLTITHPPQKLPAYEP